MNFLPAASAPAILDRLGWCLLHSLWQAALIALLLAAVLRILANRSANSRYLACCVALGLTLVWPAATFWQLAPAISESHTDGEPVANAQRSVDVPHIAEPEPAVSARAELAEPMRVGNSVDPLDPVPVPRVEAWLLRARLQLEACLPFAARGWLAGVLLVSIWHLMGWLHVEHLARRRATPAADALEKTCQRLATLLRIPRKVRLLESAAAQVPLVVGWIRPVILLPAALATELPIEQLEAVLLHELAHIRRHDYLLNLMQISIETLLFYHPAVWWISRRIRQEREFSCDDIVLATCGNRAHYARALVRVAELRLPPLHVAPAATGGGLAERIWRVLDRRDPTAPGRRPLAGTINLAIALTSVVLLLGSTMDWTFRANADAALQAAQNSDQPKSDPKANPDAPREVVGTILSADGQPVDGIEVFAFRQNGRREGSFVSDKNGQIRVPQDWWEKPHYPNQQYVLATAAGGTERGWYQVPTSGWPPRAKDAPPPAAPGPFEIRRVVTDREIVGRILDQQKEPIAGARIQSADLPLLWATTDETGRFRARFPKDWNVALHVLHPDWIGRRVLPGDRDDVGDLTLRRGGHISGRVLFADGRPKPGTTVYASQYRNSERMRTDPDEELLGDSGSAITDDAGNYRIDGLMPGEYSVSLEFPPIPDPEWLAPSMGQITLKADQTLSTDIILEKGLRLAVRVVEAKSGQPIPGGSVSAQTWRDRTDSTLPSWNSSASILSQQNGEFVVLMLPGHARIEAHVAERKGWKRLAESRLEFELSPEAPPEPITLKIEKEREGLLQLTHPKALRHEGYQLSTFAFDREGRRIVTAGYSQPEPAPEADKGKPAGLRGHITLWDAVADKEIARFPGDFGAPFDMKFSPDGKTILAGGRARNSEMGVELTLWDAETFQPIRQFEGHTRRVLRVAWSPDGRLVASGSSDRTLRVWDPATGKQLVALAHPSTPMYPVFSPDGKTLIAGCDNIVKIWNVETWQERSTIEDRSMGLHGVDVSPDGRYLAAAGIPYEPDGRSMSMSKGGLARLWHTAGGPQRATWRLEAFPTSIAFSPDGRFVAVCGHKSSIWNVESQEEVAVLQRDISSSSDRIAFSPDGKWMGIGESIGVFLWDVSALHIGKRAE